MCLILCIVFMLFSGAFSVCFVPFDLIMAISLTIIMLGVDCENSQNTNK